VSAGFPDWMPGTSSLGQDQLLASGAAVSIPAATTKTLYSGPIANISYDLMVDLLNDGTPATPVCKLSVFWQNPSGAITLDAQNWQLLTGDTSPGISNMLYSGRGPTESSYVVVTLHNYDTSAITVDYELFASARVVTRHDIRSVIFGFASEYTYQGLNGYSALDHAAAGILGYTPGIGLATSAELYRYLPLYCGQIQLSGNTSSGGSDMYLSVYAIDPDLPDKIALILTLKSDSNGNIVAENVSLPRCPCVVRITNLNAATKTMKYSAVIQEFAS
jgi:hypothetical protein